MRTSKIQNGRQGAPKWPTWSGKLLNPRFWSKHSFYEKSRWRRGGNKKKGEKNITSLAVAGALAYRLQRRTQSCKVLRHLGTSCPVGLETSSRIFKVYPMLFGMSKILIVTPTLFGYFLILLDWFWSILDIFGSNLTNFGHFVYCF